MLPVGDFLCFDRTDTLTDNGDRNLSKHDCILCSVRARKLCCLACFVCLFYEVKASLKKSGTYIHTYENKEGGHWAGVARPVPWRLMSFDRTVLDRSVGSVCSVSSF